MNKETPDKSLQSWKTIAKYFNCSERTVRRWESQEGLPVHRHHHQSGSRIFAFPKELDRWFSSRSDASFNTTTSAPTKQCIALLPFTFLAPDQNRSFVADALCEDIVNDLAGLRSLTVISYSSSRHLAAQNVMIPEMIKALSLNFYIEGSIRLDSHRARINVRLVDAGNQSVVWQAVYEEQAPDWQQLRQTIVSSLLTSLPLSNIRPLLLPSQQKILESQTAWEYVHQARRASLQWQSQGIARAIELLNAANQLAGNSDLILANLGRIYLQLRESGIDCSEQPVQKVKEILSKLRRSHPDAFYTLSLQAWFDYLQGDLNGAVSALQRAHLLQPNDPDVLLLLANCLLLSGQPEIAKPYIDTLQVVDPFTPLSRCMPGYFYLMVGDFKQAIGPYQDMLKLAPSNQLARLFMVWVLALNQDKDGVTAVCGEFESGEENSLIVNIASALRDGLCNKASVFQLDEHQARVASVNGMLARFCAFAYAANGRQEKAIYWLERAVELGFWPYPFMKDHDCYFRQFHKAPQMQALLTKMESRWKANFIISENNSFDRFEGTVESSNTLNR